MKSQSIIRMGWKPFCEPLVEMDRPVESDTLRDVGGRMILAVDIGGEYNVTAAWCVWHSNSAGTDEPWRVSQRHVVGTREASESWVEVSDGQFRRFSDAIAEAKRLCRLAIEFSERKQ